MINIHPPSCFGNMQLDVFYLKETFLQLGFILINVLLEF